MLKKDGSDSSQLYLPRQGSLLINYPSGRFMTKSGDWQVKKLAPYHLRLSCREGRLNVEHGTGLELVTESH